MYVCMSVCMYVCMHITVPLPPAVWWGYGSVGGRLERWTIYYICLYIYLNVFIYIYVYKNMYVYNYI